MMKYILIIFFTHFFSIIIAQVGTLKVRSYSNSTNDISDNIEEDSTLIRIINNQFNIDTTILLTQSNSNVNNLKTGDYKLICTIRKEEVTLKAIRISSGKLTIIELLFEPNNKLGFFQKRKRKKLYANF